MVVTKSVKGVSNMPWKETSVFEERAKFIIAWNSGDWSMTDLCNEFGISRTTGYKYLNVYRGEGIDGLKDKSRAPHRQNKEWDKHTVQIIINCRQEHPSWGPEKILAKLKVKLHKRKNWPCVATVGKILKRNGLVEGKKKRVRQAVKTQPLAHALGPNDVWCADYKGHFTVGDGKRCDPLTVTDAYSRFLLACKIVRKMDTFNAKELFKNLFQEYGMPDAIRTDNGTPFAAQSIGGLSELSVWWMKLGIRLERIDPGKPSQNGRHERMHRTLKHETALPPRSSLQAQQVAFDDFRDEYNFERPHAALDNKYPSHLYHMSEREYPGEVGELYYPTNMEVKTVSDMGRIYYGSFSIFISGALKGENIGLEEIDDRHYRIYFCDSIIGILDRFNGSVLQYRNPVPHIFNRN